MQRTMLAAVQATAKRLITPRNLMQISAPPPSIFSLAQNDDNHWRPNPGCTAGVVTPLTPGVPQSPAVERYFIMQQNHS